MKEMGEKESKRVRSEAATKHLLDTRAKQIKTLQADIAGYEETVRLCAAFIGQLCIALIGEDKASCGVTCAPREGGAFALSISRQALTHAIGKWQIGIEKEAEAYRVVMQEKKEEN